MVVSLTAGLLLLGVAVVAPLALNRLDLGAIIALRMVVPAGALAAVSLLLPPGPLAPVLALPWLAVAGATTVRAVRPTARAVTAARSGTLASAGLGVVGVGPGAAVERPLGPPSRAGGGVASLTRAVAPMAATGFWTIGAGWLVADRSGVDPIGVGPDLVLLTAVHFHFAGLAATTIVLASAGSGRLGMLCLIGTLVAPVLVAVGFVAVPALQVVGAVVFTGALLAWSVQAGAVPGGGVREGMRGDLRGGVRGGLWWLARLSVWISMPLAVWWAVGHVTGLGAPSIPTMAATHGVANAVGFALAGLLALPRAASRPIRRARPEPGVSGSGRGAAGR